MALCNTSEFSCRVSPVTLIFHIEQQTELHCISIVLQVFDESGRETNGLGARFGPKQSWNTRLY